MVKKLGRSRVAAKATPPAFSDSDELFVSSLVQLCSELREPVRVHKPIQRFTRKKAATPRVSSPPNAAKSQGPDTSSQEKGLPIEVPKLPKLSLDIGFPEVEDLTQLSPNRMHDLLLLRMVDQLLGDGESPEKREYYQKLMSSCLNEFRKKKALIENPRAFLSFRAEYPTQMNQTACIPIKISYLTLEKLGQACKDPSLMGRRLKKAILTEATFQRKE